MSRLEQLKAQQKLSHGQNPGTDSSGVSLDDNSSSKNTPGITTKTSGGGRKISRTVFGIMLAVGLFLDIIGVIPFIGWGISSLALLFIYIMLGVEFHMKNIFKFGACDFIKLIPGLSVIPTFVLSVILNLGPMVEDLGKGIPGGEQLANKAQQALSMTKK